MEADNPTDNTMCYDLLLKRYENRNVLTEDFTYIFSILA